jgi:hypothetical protein
MKDAVTIVVVHISRQQGQPLLHVGQEPRLKADANFLKHINEPPSQRAGAGEGGAKSAIYLAGKNERYFGVPKQDAPSCMRSKRGFYLL